MQTNEGCCPPPSARKKRPTKAAVTKSLAPEGALAVWCTYESPQKLAAKGLPVPRYRYIEVRFGRRRADQARAMGWAGNRVSPQITATPLFPVGSRVLMKPTDPKGKKKGMMVDCDGVVISVWPQCDNQAVDADAIIVAVLSRRALKFDFRPGAGNNHKVRAAEALAGRAGPAGLRLLRQDRRRRLCDSC